MVKKGKHHTQAICACASHLLDRVLTVYRKDRPYELHDVDGPPVIQERALEIIQPRYQVPDEVRRRNHQRTRREPDEHRLEKKAEGKLRKERGHRDAPSQ